MVRTSLLVALAVLVAAPAAAQEEFTWTPDRPDGHAPLGVRTARTLESGAFQVSYRFSKLDDRGVWFDNDSLPLSTTLDFYPVAPLSQDNLSHELELAYGLSDDFTLLGSISYVQMERQSFSGDDDFIYITEADELADAELHGLWSFLDEGAYTANLRAGFLIPTGEFDVTAETPFGAEEELAYDMRPGAGVWGFLPGISAQVQNEFGSVGGQITGRIHFGTNDSGFAPGDRFTGTFWGAYKLNDAFSISGRAEYQAWSRIEGFDPDLDPARDPSNDEFFAEGSMLTLPVGLNFVIPGDSPLAGHRLAIEYITPIEQSYEGPQLGFSRGLVVGWQAVF